MSEMTGYRYIAEMLHGYGIRAVFHVPYVLDGALVEMEKLGIRRIRCHTEKAAAYMADGYARVARGPGIAMAQSVGAANLAAGLQDAWLAGSPVIAVTGRWMPHYLYQQAYQEIDHRPLYDPVTKFNAYVDGVEQIPIHAAPGLSARPPRARPGRSTWTVLGLSGDIAAGSKLDAEVTVESSFARYPAFRPEPEPGRVAEAARRIARSERPVLVAGGGVTASGAQAEMVRLAEKISVPVATSLNAKGTIPEHHPLSAGVVGTYSRKCANEIVSEADLVIFVGSHTGGQVSHFWQIPRQGTPAIQIDVDPGQIGRNYPAEVAIQGRREGDAGAPHRGRGAGPGPGGLDRTVRAHSSTGGGPSSTGCSGPMPCPSAPSGFAVKSPNSCRPTPSSCRTRATPACGRAR